jgi:uncharacterized OB-fold protein
MTSRIVSEFREGLARGELLIQKCNECSRLNMYPRYACPYCQSQSLGWQRASGQGVLHSFTVLRLGAPEGFEEELPYAVGVVKLEEGVQLLVRLLPDAAGDWQSYRCDDQVKFSPMAAEQIQRRPCAWFTRARS